MGNSQSSTSAENTSSHQPSTSCLAAILMILTVLWINLSAILTYDRFNPLAFGIFFLLTLYFRLWSLMHCALLIFLWSIGDLYMAGLFQKIPIVKSLLPLVLSTLFLFSHPNTKRTLLRFRFGRLDPVSVVLLFATSLASISGLLLWASNSDYFGSGELMVKNLSVFPKWLILGPGILLFAILNGFVEETIFRGIVQKALSDLFRPPIWVFVLQASAFAAMHFQEGFPNGWDGYLLTFTYGLVLGYLRHRTDGLLAPWLTHFIADVAIGYLVVLTFL